MRIDRFSKILVLTGLCIFLSGGLFSAMAQDVIRASGGTDISVDAVTSGEYTTISGPTIRETQAGQLAENGTIVLTLPNGYEWNANLTAEDITIEVVPVGGANTQLDVSFTSISESEFTITVETPSTTRGQGQGLGRVEIEGLQLRPTNTNVPDEGTIFNTGSTGPDANYGNLSKVAGSISQVLVETAADGSGNVVSAQNLRAADDLTVFSIARDIGGNFIENIALDNEDDWSLIEPGDIPAAALSPATNRKSATFNSQQTGTTQIRAFLDGVDLTPSETITVTPRPANSLQIESQPSTTATAGEAFEDQPVIHLLDIFGNLVTTDSETEVSASISDGDGTISGTLSQTANEGVITFTNLMLEKANTVTLKFTSPDLSSVNSNEIVIEPNVERDLDYLEQPTNTAQNSTIEDPPVVVRLLDDFGNFVKKSGEDITIVAKDDQNVEPNDFFKNNATTVAPTNNDGIAIFNELDLHNNAAEGEYTLEASFTGINDPVASNTFQVISSGDFAKFTVTDTNGNLIDEQEEGVQAGDAFMIRISARDGDDNIYDTFEDDFEGTIELTADSDIGESVQTTFTEQDFTNGILETSFTLTSSGETRVYAGFEGTDGEGNPIARDGRSNIFNVLPTDVDFANTVVSASPSQITADGTSTTEVTVQLRDEFGNNLITGGETITIQTDAGTLSNGTENGVTSLSAIDESDGTYTATLTSSTNIETATVEAFEESDTQNPIGSVLVDFTAGSLDNFIITIPTDNGEPSTQTAGVEFPITVEAVDENGNRVESYSGELDFTSNSVIREGDETAEIANGILVDHSIVLEQSGSNITISVEDNEVFGVDGTSPEFVVVPAGPSPENSNVLVNPTVIQNDGTSTSTITVVLRDEFENRIQENLIDDISLSLEQIEEDGNPSSSAPEATLDDLSYNAGANNYQATITASTTVEIVEIKASLNGVEINQIATLNIVVPNTWSPGGGPEASQRDWTNGDNWSLGTQPTEDDFVIIPGDVDPYPDLDLNTTIGSLEVQDGGQLVLFGGNDFDIRGGVEVDGTFDIENNTSLTVGGNFTGAGTFTAGTNAIVEINGNTSISNFFAGTEGTTVRFNGDSQQTLNSDNFLVRNIEVFNDVLAVSGDVIEAFGIFIDEGATFELQQDADITLDNIENIFGNGSLILNNNTLVLRGDLSILNIDTSEGTVIFGIRQDENFADYPDIQRQQIQNLTQMKNAIINNTEGVLTFDDIIIDEGGTLTLENGELIISSGRNFIANDITYNGGALTFSRSLSQPGWRLLSSPITSTFQDWFDGLTLQGMENTSFPDRQPNLLFYDETFEGTDNQRWRTPANATDELTPGRGYFFFVFGDVEGDEDYGDEDYNDSLPQTLTVTGQEHTPAATESHLDLNVTYTAEADTGFNLVGNPYGATIDWDHESWVKENMDDVIYVWDESTNQYRTWNGVSGSLESGNIAPFQGFWVKANNENKEITPSLKVSPEAKTTGGTFLKSQRSSAEHEWPVLEMQVAGAGMQHSTHFTFTEGGRNNIDNRDAYRLLPFDTNTYLEIFTLLDDGTELAINNLPRTFGKPIELPLHVSGLNDGAIIDNTITLTWPKLINIPDDWKIILHDTHSNESINLRDHSFYDFTLNARAKTPPEMNTRTNFRLVEKSMAKKQSARFTIEIDPGADAHGIPDEVILNQNFPNPFNQTTTIRFGIPIEQRAKIVVYDVLGRRVQTITDQRYQPGYHDIEFNGRPLASGVYFYRLVTDEKVLDKQMTLIK